MADNVAITPGTGDVVAADDVAGAKFQRIKVDVGGDGAALPVSSTATPKAVYEQPDIECEMLVYKHNRAIYYPYCWEWLR